MARPKFADIAVISTLDRMHAGPAIKELELARERGYRGTSQEETADIHSYRD